MKLLILLLTIMLSPVVCATTVVVVAKSSSIEALDDQYIANIFLARTNRFPNGDKALPIELKNHALRDSFYKEISGKTSKQLYAYWTTLVFTGKGKPPRSYKDNEALNSKLLSSPGSITYMPIEQVTDDMKIVYRFP